MIDSHAHLYFDRFDEDRVAVVKRARDAGVDRVINIGIDAATSRQAIDLASEFPGFYATAGIHPTSPVEDPEAAVAEIGAIARAHPGAIVAVGEIGLDYYWKDVSPRDQDAKLRLQLQLARDLVLPVIFHCRDALADLFALLESEDQLPSGVFHCFGGDAEDARRALELGFHVSFAGNVTFPKAESLRRAAAAVPPEQILLETDAPFLAPQARRGKRNEPAFLRFTRDTLAELYGLDPDELEELATQATVKLFGLDSRGKRMTNDE